MNMSVIPEASPLGGEETNIIPAPGPELSLVPPISDTPEFSPAAAPVPRAIPPHRLHAVIQQASEGVKLPKKHRRDPAGFRHYRRHNDDILLGAYPKGDEFEKLAQAAREAMARKAAWLSFGQRLH
jgi:hypothetical protein